MENSVIAESDLKFGSYFLRRGKRLRNGEEYGSKTG